MIAVGSTVYSCETVSTIAARRENVQQASEMKCPSGEACARESLQADIRAADAAEGALDLSAGQIGFNIVGLMGLGLTLYYAHRAWEEARRSANIASDSAKRQLRAYLIISNVKFEHMGNSRRRTLVISTDNYGATPATEVRTWRKIKFDRFPIHEDFEHDFPNDRISGRDVIGPGQKQTSRLAYPMLLDRQKLRGFLLGYYAVYVWGRISYKDIYGDDHVTDFRFVAHGSRTGQVQADLRGNYMS